MATRSICAGGIPVLHLDHIDSKQGHAAADFHVQMLDLG